MYDSGQMAERSSIPHLSYTEDKPVLNLFIPMQRDLNCHQLISTLKNDFFYINNIEQKMIMMPKRINL